MVLRLSRPVRSKHGLDVKPYDYTHIGRGNKESWQAHQSTREKCDNPASCNGRNLLFSVVRDVETWDGSSGGVMYWLCHSSSIFHELVIVSSCHSLPIGHGSTAYARSILWYVNSLCFCTRSSVNEVLLLHYVICVKASQGLATLHVSFRLYWI